MPDSSPKRTLRSNSSSGLTLNDIKDLIEAMRTDILDNMKSENKKMNENIQQILSRLENLEWTNRELNLENRQLKEEVESLKAAQNNILLETADELHLRSLRQNNLILFGVPEKLEGSIEDRRSHDSLFCQKMLIDLGLEESFEHLHRIGRLKQGATRPLRLKCESQNQRSRILRSSKGLKDIPKYKTIFINPDRTPLQLENDKKLREEVRSQRSHGNDVVIFKGKIVERESMKNFHGRF